MYTIRKEVIIPLQMFNLDPLSKRVTRLLGDFELHRSLGLLLYHHGTRGHPLAVRNIAHMKLHQITPAKFAIDCQIKERTPGRVC